MVNQFSQQKSLNLTLILSDDKFHQEKSHNTMKLGIYVILIPQAQQPRFIYVCLKNGRILWKSWKVLISD